MKKIRTVCLLATAAACLAAAALLATFGLPAMQWVDIHYAGETMKDSWGRWRFQEDWRSAPRLRPHQDYRWVTPGMLVAHALGGAGSAGQDTLAAMDVSLAQGMRVLEIDVWLDEAGLLRCHHGPQAPLPLKAGECTWEQVRARASAAHAWLILDLKTDFRTTAQALLARLPDRNAATNLIFQLYKPEHVGLFAAWQQQYPLPGPLVTAYVAKRSLRHIAAHTRRIGVHVLTLPLHRRAALAQHEGGLQLLVHPVQDCADLRSSAPATGYYVSSSAAARIGRTCSPQGRP